MTVTVRRASEADAVPAAALVQEGFLRFVAPDWSPDAQRVFLVESGADRLRLLMARAAYTAVAEVSEHRVGFILLTKPAVLDFLFVHPDWFRRRVATTLWDSARKELAREYPALQTIEVNATPYAVRAYEALGFRRVSDTVEKAGTVSTRMTYPMAGGDRTGRASGAEPRVSLGSRGGKESGR